MKKTITLLFIYFTFALLTSKAQKSDTTSKIDFNMKLATYFTLNGGWGVSASFGAWQTFKRVQPATSISFNMIAGRKNLGNKNRYNSNWQLNTVFSPTLSLRLGKLRKGFGIYEELHPAYFGGANSLYCNYRNSITAGSTFITSPKGYGKNKNTFRNRSQQLVYLGMRFGNRNRNVQLHLYEDFLLTDNALLQFLADNFDRYYTGGANLQLRINPALKVSFYSETYTGNFEYDLFDYPDIYNQDVLDSLKNLIITSKKRQLTWFKKTVFQDPGQKMLNGSRTFMKVDYDQRYRKTTVNYDQYSLLLGFNDRKNWQQNLIHNLNGTQKISTYKPYQWDDFDKLKNDTKSLRNKDIINEAYVYLKPSKSKYNEGKHYFEQVSPKNRLFIGVYTSFSNFNTNDKNELPK